MRDVAQNVDKQEERVVDDGSTGVEIEDISGGQNQETPFDPSKIRISARLLTVDLILSRIKNKELDLYPSFQRKSDIWSEAAQSRLIESLLIRIPIPALYMDATNEERWLVVDGLQRLTALRRFVLAQDLRLSGLEYLAHLHGKIFSDLDPRLQRRIKETQFTVYVIEEGTPPQCQVQYL